MFDSMVCIVLFFLSLLKLIFAIHIKTNCRINMHIRFCALCKISHTHSVLNREMEFLWEHFSTKLQPDLNKNLCEQFGKLSIILKLDKWSSIKL